MKQQEEYLIIRYWSGELTGQEEQRAKELLNSKAHRKEALQIINDLQFQQELVNAERESSTRPFSKGSLLEQSLKQWEEESKVVPFKLGWLAPTIGVAAAIVIGMIVFQNNATRPSPATVSKTTDFVEPVDVTTQPETEGMYATNREITQLELSIAHAATTRRFSRHHSNLEGE